METELDYVTALRVTVDQVAERLREIPDVVASARPAPDKWCVKEIVGHLIDSAANNHRRFVQARWQDELVFPGYAQDDWVAVQDYRSALWPELVMLWQTYNHHLARVMAAVPADVRTRVHRRHNLDQIAWQTVPADQPATLDYFMRDYVGHLEHHVAQIARIVGW
jgi:hypothetical protein